MAQASAIAAWLMLLFKVVMWVMVFLIVMLCLLLAIRSRKVPKKNGAEREE